VAVNARQRFAPLGLALALLAALVSAGLFIVQRAWNLPLQISLVLIVVGLALFVFLDPGRARALLTGRQARYGSNALVLSLAFAGILIVVNYLAINNPQRWDLTEDQRYTLAPETLAALQALEQPVRVQAFFSPDRPTDQARSILDQYAFQSEGRFTYEFINPVQDPVAAEQAGITQDGSLVIWLGENKQIVTALSEVEITGALVRLMNPEAQTVYFLTGHGERSPEDSGSGSLALLKRLLESKNYTVATLNLIAGNQIPADAQAVVVAGPQQPLTREEVDLLQGFLEGGGGLLVLAEPTLLADSGEAEDPLAAYLAEDWGIVLGDDMVVDLSSAQASTVAVGAEFGTHVISSSLAGWVTLMPSARSLSLEARENGASQSLLVSTSGQAWAETNLEALQVNEVSPDEGEDIFGPVALGAAAENFATEGRVVVFGDAEFITNEFISAYGNADLIVNSVDWAVGEEALINLTPKETTQRLLVPPQAVTMNLIFLGVVILLPGAALAAGTAVWVQRRRRR
jgi:ABC-type uncharacterized transport system involved in gliding motility auxiliary subunit